MCNLKCAPHSLRFHLWLAFLSLLVQYMTKSCVRSRSVIFRWAGKRRKVVLRALLSLVFALAPLLAQMTMSGQVSAAARAVASSVHDHAEHAHDHGASGTSHSDHEHSDHDYTTEELGRSHTSPNLKMPGVTPCPSGHGDHDNAGDAGCCGTFCHSAMALLALPTARHHYGCFVFGVFVGMPTDPVAPEQPHRPPASPLSLS
jgi:hypothetical protein